MNRKNLTEFVEFTPISVESRRESVDALKKLNNDVQKLNINSAKLNEGKELKLRSRAVRKTTYVPKKRPRKINFSELEIDEGNFEIVAKSDMSSEDELEGDPQKMGDQDCNKKGTTEIVQKVVEELVGQFKLDQLANLLQNIDIGASTSTAAQKHKTGLNVNSLEFRANGNAGGAGGDNPNNPNNPNGRGAIRRVPVQEDPFELDNSSPDLHFQKMRQSALAAAMNIKSFYKNSYRVFLTEVENIISIYEDDSRSVEIILRAATQKVPNPLIRERCFEDFESLKCAIEGICSTKMDYRSYSNEIANAAQGSNQPIEHFGDYIARLLQDQIAAYLQDDKIKSRPKEYQQEDLERFSQTAAMNFVEGISNKFEKLKERLQIKEYETLQEAINEAKRISKQLDNEKKKAMAKKNEEFLAGRIGERSHQKFRVGSKFNKVVTHNPNKGENRFNKFGKPQNNAKPMVRQGQEPRFGKPKEKICYNCQKPGHISTDCPEPRKKRENVGELQNSQPYTARNSQNFSRNSQNNERKYVRVLNAEEYEDEDHDYDQKNSDVPVWRPVHNSRTSNL